MLKVVVSVSVPNGYESRFVTVGQGVHTVTFTLENGNNIAKSNVVELGIIHGFEGRRLLGEFTFEYSYDTERRTITVCGTDFDSAASMCLTSMPDGSSEYCRQRAAGGGFIGDDRISNPHWNYSTPLTPGLQDVLAGVVRTVNDRVIDAFNNEPGVIVHVRTAPPELSPEEQHKFQVVYTDGVFQGLYTSQREYGAGDVVTTIESVWGGTVAFKNNEKFANVIGSSNDPKIDGMAWLQLWQSQFGNATVCTSYQFNGFKCGNTLYGGHVITGMEAKIVPKGSNAVYILPICQQHNNDDRVYMAALTNLNGVWLKNYLGS